MSENHDAYIQVTNDYDAAEVVLTCSQVTTNGQQVVAGLDPRIARQIAIDLLKAADVADANKAENAQRPGGEVMTIKLTKTQEQLLSKIVLFDRWHGLLSDGRSDRAQKALTEAGLIEAEPWDDKFPPRTLLHPTEAGRAYHEEHLR